MADPADYFYLKDGGALKDMKELYAALEQMPQDVFEFHCNTQKNDFAAWVRGVFKAEAVAARMDAITSRDELKTLLRGQLFPTKSKRESASLKEKNEVSKPLPSFKENITKVAHKKIVPVPSKKIKAPKTAAVAKKTAVENMNKGRSELEEGEIRITKSHEDPDLTPLEKTAIDMEKQVAKVMKHAVHDTIYSFVAGFAVGIILMIVIYYSL